MLRIRISNLCGVMNRWVESDHCASKAHCHACKAQGLFVQRMKRHWIMPDVCPYQHGAERPPATPTRVDPELLRLDWGELAARVIATGDESGRRLVEHQQTVRDEATCTPCATRATEARLRVWLSRRAAGARK